MCVSTVPVLPLGNVLSTKHISRNPANTPCFFSSIMFSVWTEESSCSVINSTIAGEINCTYSCGSDCRKTSKYPCLQVSVSLNASGKTVRLLLNEEMHNINPDVSPEKYAILFHIRGAKGIMNQTSVQYLSSIVRFMISITAFKSVALSTQMENLYSNPSTISIFTII